MLRGVLWVSCFIEQGRNSFLEKGIYSSKETYISKKEMTLFCNKLSMEVNIAIEFNREKYDVNCKPISCLLWQKSYQYPFKKSIYKVLSFKPVYTFPI